MKGLRRAGPDTGRSGPECDHDTLTKIITSVYSASDSINANPRIKAKRMAAAAAGLRAMPSAAAAVARACPSPHRPEAIAMAKPAVITTHWCEASAGGPWANTGAAQQSRDANNSKMETTLIFFSCL